MQVRIEQSVWPPGRRGPRPKVHPQKQKNKQRRARNTTYDCTHTQNARNSRSPENTNRQWDVRGKYAKVAFSRGLFVQIQQGQNYETRRCSGFPHGAECPLLTHFLGVPENVIPMPATQNCVCSVNTNKRKATASFTCGNVREHAVPRHWHHVPVVDFCATAK